MDDFDTLVAEMKKRGMHLIMDLVVNHCSDKHEWFQKALADPDGPYAGYFYFREGKDGKVTSNIINTDPCDFMKFFTMVVPLDSFFIL